MDGPTPEKIKIGRDEFETVARFCYLGDVLGQAGGCADYVTARIRSAWKAFRELLPIITTVVFFLRKEAICLLHA